MTTLDARIDALSSGIDPDPAPLDDPSLEASQRRLPKFSVSLRQDRHPMAWVLVSVAALAAWVFLFATVTSVTEHSNQNRLYAKFREQLALGTAPIGGAIETGEPVALIEAPSLGMNGVVVVEGTASRQTMRGPGHLATSPLPGQAGWSMLFGRSALYGAPFKRIERAAAGTTFAVTTALGTYHYKVDRVRHAGAALPAIPPSGSGLILASANSSGLLGVGSVFYVDASLTDKELALTPTGRPNLILSSEAPLKGDSATLIPLVLWLEVLTVAVVLVVFAWRRWGVWQTWLAGLPVVLAALWGTTTAALALLPNLL